MRKLLIPCLLISVVSLGDQYPVQNSTNQSSMQRVMRGTGVADGSGNLAVSFSTAFASGTPDCIATDEGGAPKKLNISVEATTTGVTFAGGGTTSGDTFHWVCMGVN